MTYHYKVENEFLIKLYNVHTRTCISHSVIRNPWPCSLNIDCKSKWNRLWASNEVLIHDIDQANCHYKIWIEWWKWLIKILNLFYNSILTKMIAASPFFSDCKLIVHVLQNSNYPITISFLLSTLGTLNGKGGYLYSLLWYLVIEMFKISSQIKCFSKQITSKWEKKLTKLKINIS